MSHVRGTIIAATLVAAVAFACRPAAQASRGEGEPIMGPQLERELAAVRAARILFMHHSVGRDVLAGIEALDAELGGGRIRMTTLHEAAADPAPLLAHFSGGRNTDPKSKMDAFAAALRAEPRLLVDVALMKLCYVDFDPRTDVAGLLAHYQRTAAEIRDARPDVRLAHVSVPLTRRPTDLKSSVRRLLGLEVWEDAANARRAEFNRRLAAAFPQDPAFDLAKVEATAPDGAVSTFEYEGALHQSLHPGYTDDGGHLNAAGRRAAGAAAIRFLAAAVGSGVAGR